MQNDLTLCKDLILPLSAELKSARRKIASLLLSFGERKQPRQHLSQNEIARTLGISWDLVHNSLVSLRQANAIKLDRHRLALDRPKLERIVVNKE